MLLMENGIRRRVGGRFQRLPESRLEISTDARGDRMYLGFDEKTSKEMAIRVSSSVI